MQSNLMIRKVIYHNNTRSAHDHRCRAQKKKKRNNNSQAIDHRG